MMNLVDKLKSDLEIAEYELSILDNFYEKDISNELYYILSKTTKSRIECINKQISELESNTKYIDRRETGYVH
jgi:hypothetical protein